MQERQHVKTVPGEPHAAPEYAPHAVHKEDGHNVQMDDINIPLLAITVAFFAVLLGVLIISLQAWVYNYQTAQQTLMTKAQDDPETWLGGILREQRAELREPGTARLMAPATNPAEAKRRIPIDNAMQMVEQQYAGGQGR